MSHRCATRAVAQLKTTEVPDYPHNYHTDRQSVRFLYIDFKVSLVFDAQKSLHFYSKFNQQLGFYETNDLKQHIHKAQKWKYMLTA